MNRTREMKRNGKYEELDFKGFFLNSLRLITLRKVKKIGLISIGILVVLYFLLRKSPDDVQSAITCKNKIADIVYPRPKEKLRHIEQLDLEATTLEEEYFNLMTLLTRQCFSQMHMGPSDDGGWEVCVDKQFDLRPPCLVYSFGIGGDFRFEKDMENKLKCEVHAFDPSMGVESHQYSLSGYFHNVGIDSMNTWANKGKWKMRKLSTIMEDLKHTDRDIDYLKMDVEFSEWPALHEIIKSGLIHRVRQLGVEVHTPEMEIHTQPDNACTWSTRESYAFIVKVLLELQNAGFHLYYSRTNYKTVFKSRLTGVERFCCYNLHYVNTKHTTAKEIKMAELDDQ